MELGIYWRQQKCVLLIYNCWQDGSSSLCLRSYSSTLPPSLSILIPVVRSMHAELRAPISCWGREVPLSQWIDQVDLSKISREPHSRCCAYRDHWTPVLVDTGISHRNQNPRGIWNVEKTEGCSGELGNLFS